MIRDRLLNNLKQVLREFEIDEADLQLEHPVSLAHGDYSTNIALKYAKKLNTTPQELAEKIKEKIKSDELIKKVEVVKPGFINFFILEKSLISEVQKIVEEKSKYGKKDKKGSKIILEYGQPNTHKTPHIGHLFSYIYGESLSRILENEGNQIFRANYQGDIGLHVAKCLYKVKEKMGEVKKLKTLREKVDFLQKCYEEGSQLYEKDKKVEKEIDQISIQLYKKDSGIYDLWQETRKWCLDFYKEFEEMLGIKYDKSYFESETSEIGKKIVEENVGKVFEKSQDAIVFKGEEKGLHTRVFINKYGNPTYEAKDIGLLSLKLKNYPFDLSIVTTASEQNEYWKVVIAASELIFPEVKGKLKHLGFGMINLTTGKMSSRKGTTLEAFKLFEEVENKIKEKYKSNDSLSKKIASAAIKYAFLKSDAFKNISFDVEKSVSQEGDSGPYLLYTFVRTKSILEKSPPTIQIDAKNLNDEELEILRTVYQFPEMIERASHFYSPHILASYLFSLAQRFNLFYQKHKIIKSEGSFRIILTSAVGQVIKNGLELLGIETVEKM